MTDFEGVCNRASRKSYFHCHCEQSARPAGYERSVVERNVRKLSLTVCGPMSAVCSLPSEIALPPTAACNGRKMGSCLCYKKSPRLRDEGDSAVPPCFGRKGNFDRIFLCCNGRPGHGYWGVHRDGLPSWQSASSVFWRSRWAPAGLPPRFPCSLSG